MTDKKSEYNRRYRNKHKDKIRKYFDDNKSIISEKAKRKRAQRTAEEIIADNILAKERREARKEENKKYMKIYRENNSEKIKIKTIEYRNTNKENDSLTREKNIKNIKEKMIHISNCDTTCQ